MPTSLSSGKRSIQVASTAGRRSDALRYEPMLLVLTWSSLVRNGFGGSKRRCSIRTALRELARHGPTGRLLEGEPACGRRAKQAANARGLGVDDLEDQLGLLVRRLMRAVRREAE